MTKHKQSSNTEKRTEAILIFSKGKIKTKAARWGRLSVCLSMGYIRIPLYVTIIS